MQREKSILDLKEITKTFSGITALEKVTFSLHQAEIHALCGENGAGKSTLINILSGVYGEGEYGGEMVLFDELVRFRHIREAEQAGIAVVHQEFSLIPEMTVAENIYLGSEPTKNKMIDWSRLYKKTADLLAYYKLDLNPHARIQDLGIGQQQLVEIAKALSKSAKILLLDEPTAALTETETETLLDIVRSLQEEGIACIYISHKLEEVLAVADRITVLRDGKNIITTAAKETSKEEIIQHMVGRAVTALHTSAKRERSSSTFQVEHLSVSDRGKTILSDISFTVHQGEILGIGGLMGSGRTELLMHLFGAYGVRREGRVLLHGEPFVADNPHACVECGMALVCEDRKTQGIHLDQSVGFNLSLSSLKQFHRYGLGNYAQEFSANKHTIETLNIKTPHQEIIAQQLSGGNQQKIVLGKMLMTQPDILLLDEPTRGIDVGAKQEIYHLIDQFAQEGNMVLLVSSELRELLNLSDNIMILSEGKIGGMFTREQATQEKIMHAAMAHH